MNGYISLQVNLRTVEDGDLIVYCSPCGGLVVVWRPLG